MNPFEQAWALLKMPLDYDSIEQVGDKQYHANFIHPETGEVFPMVASDFGLGYESGIYRPGQRPELTQGSVMTSDALSHLVLTGGDRDYAWGTKTEPSHRRMGMASALYDLSANIRDEEDGAVIIPSFDRSSQGKELWGRYEKEGHWPRNQYEKERMLRNHREREAEWEKYKRDARRRRMYRRLQAKRLQRQMSD